VLVLAIHRATLTLWPLHAIVALRTEELETVEIESDSNPSLGVWTKNQISFIPKQIQIKSVESSLDLR
jgi:hypothetical protein